MENYAKNNIKLLIVFIIMYMLHYIYFSDNKKIIHNKETINIENLVDISGVLYNIVNSNFNNKVINKYLINNQYDINLKIIKCKNTSNIKNNNMLYNNILNGKIIKSPSNRSLYIEVSKNSNKVVYNGCYGYMSIKL